MLHARLAFPIFISALALSEGACNGSVENDFDSGGTGPTGGASTMGGAGPMGGANPMGGAAGTGVSGGAGVSGSAGSTQATGGTGTGTGGTDGAGQSGAAGAGIPMAGMGGASTTGGASSGAGGPTTGGVGGGSAGAGMGGAAPTTGCGAATWPAGDGRTVLTIDVGGTQREYIVAIPTAYDTNHPYRLVFAWHGRTGTAGQVAGNFYGLKNPMGATTIFVSGQGLGIDSPTDTGWANTNGQDVAFVRALVTSLESSYCIDHSRIMSVGMSYGGIMSYTLACQMSDVFRAIAPIAGASFGGGRGSTCGTNHVAVWAAHGSIDDQVTFANGTAAKDSYVTRNHCMTTTTALSPSPCPSPATDACLCEQYNGCDAGYPVVWCTHNRGHVIPSWSGPGISAFFQQF